MTQENKIPRKGSYSIAEVQQILRISRPTIYVLIRQKVFDVVKVRGSVRIVKSSFDAWLDQEQERIQSWRQL